MTDILRGSLLGWSLLQLVISGGLLALVCAAVWYKTGHCRGCGRTFTDPREWRCRKCGGELTR